MDPHATVDEVVMLVDGEGDRIDAGILERVDRVLLGRGRAVAEVPVPVVGPLRRHVGEPDRERRRAAHPVDSEIRHGIGVGIPARHRRRRRRRRRRGEHKPVDGLIVARDGHGGGRCPVCGLRAHGEQAERQKQQGRWGEGVPLPPMKCVAMHHSPPAAPLRERRLRTGGVHPARRGWHGARPGGRQRVSVIPRAIITNSCIRY
jgi:hypothetical protein